MTGFFLDYRVFCYFTKHEVQPGTNEADVPFLFFNKFSVARGQILEKIREVFNFHDSLFFEDTSEYCFFLRPGIFGQ